MSSYCLKCFKYSFIVILISFIIYNFMDNSSGVYKNTHQMIQAFGYPAETHTVKTEDGYLIDIYRIPYWKKTRKPGPPVIIQHGFCCSSEMFVFLGPGKDLAFMLADEGFDVWITNSRANAHARPVPDRTTKFNDFSFEEMGLYDIVSFIEYITTLTGYKKLNYIGHSMGTISFFAGMSLRPEYLDKINYMIALAPTDFISFDSNSKKPFEREYAFFGSWGEFWFDHVGVFDRGLIRSVLLSSFINLGLQSKLMHYEGNLLEPVAANSSIKYKNFPHFLVLSHIPQGIVYHTLKHFEDASFKRKFVRRNFGVEENLKRYNTSQPPEYDVSKITIPISVYYGGFDSIIYPADTERLVTELPNVKKVRLFPEMNHLDLIWCEEAQKVLNQEVIADLKMANNLDI